MKIQSPAHVLSAPGTVWSIRILVLAIGGILFLTLYPFKFGLPTGGSGWALPFLLQSGLKRVGLYDDFLNVMLFVPFGFGLAGILCNRAKPRYLRMILVWGAGALLSYTIEFTQYYVPYRDSGWHDVITNSSGALIGSILFELIGAASLRFLFKTEGALSGLLTQRRAVLVISAYYAIWLVASVPLQAKSQLSNWDPNCHLIVGNLAPGRPNTAWKGELYRLELWDKAIPDEVAMKLTSGQRGNIAPTGLLAAYDFTSATPLKDEQKNLPDLSWTSVPAVAEASQPLLLDGKSWLTSRVAVPELVKSCQRTKQFSLHVVCLPSEPEGEDKRIFSLSRTPGVVDLDFGQNRGDLVFWFRNPMSVRRAPLLWIATDLFKSKKVHDILFSYDGTALSLFIDGHKDSHDYRLGPGTVLGRLVRKVKPAELEACRYIYYGLVFFPGGILLGITARNMTAGLFGRGLAWGVALLIPPVLLELILVRVSGRGILPSGVILSLCFTIAGMWWINLRNRDLEHGKS